MAGLGEHVAAMVRSHVEGDDPAFYSVAMQVAAGEARQGRREVADDIKRFVDLSRRAVSRAQVTKLAQPRGDLAELVTASHPDVTLKDLVAPATLDAQLKHLLAEQRQRKNLLAHGFTPAYRLLLEGPPGTGKTMTAAVLASELNLPLFTVRLDGVLSKFMGETAGKLRTVFEAAAARRGVYLFDEFDALGADRAGNDVGEARRTLNSFLVFLENANSESVVVAATNHRGLLDRALFRRFDLVLAYGMPDEKQAAVVMRARLGTMGKGLRWSKVVEHADGLSHAELVKAAEAAAKVALLRSAEKVSEDDLTAALAARKAAAID